MPSSTLLCKVRRQTIQPLESKYGVNEGDSVVRKTKRGPTLGPPFVTPLQARCPYLKTGYPRETNCSTVSICNASVWPEYRVSTTRFMYLILRDLAGHALTLVLAQPAAHSVFHRLSGLEYGLVDSSVKRDAFTREFTSQSKCLT